MEIKYICKFCNTECKNANSHRNHERLCPSNPERNYVSHTIGRKAWNKGLTKETNECVAKFSKTLSEKYSGKNSPWYGKHHSMESIEKMKETCGGYRQGSGRGKHGWYKGIWCDSSWELAFVIFNLEHDIKFERCWEKFEYMFNGQKKHYFPDFKMADGTYVEIKGYENELWEAKLKQFPNALKVLKHDEMLPYLTYVKEKYGENFIELYDK